MPASRGRVSIRGGTGGTIGAATGNPYIDKVLRQFQSAQARSNAANERRYQDILSQYGPLVQEARGAMAGVPQMYQDIVGAYGQRTADLTGLLQGFGDVQREQLGTRYARDVAKTEQDMINRGLTSTTVRQDALRGTREDYGRDLRALEDQLTRQQMDYRAQLTGQELGARSMVPASTMDVAQQRFSIGERPLQFMERRTDVGPDMSAVASLAAMAGQGGAPASPYPAGGGGSAPMSRVDRMRAGIGGVGVAPLANVRTIGY